MKRITKTENSAVNFIIAMVIILIATTLISFIIAVVKDTSIVNEAQF